MRPQEEPRAQVSLLPLFIESRGLPHLVVVSICLPPSKRSIRVTSGTLSNLVLFAPPSALPFLSLPPSREGPIRYRYLSCPLSNPRRIERKMWRAPKPKFFKVCDVAGVLEGDAGHYRFSSRTLRSSTPTLCPTLHVSGPILRRERTLREG